MRFFRENVIKKKKLKAFRLRRYRELHNIGLRELARKVQVSPSTISAIELGQSYVKKDTAYKIEKALLEMANQGCLSTSLSRP